MATSITKAVASGATFGAALTAAGVYSPAVIISQMHLTNFHMLEAFVAGSASSAIAIVLAKHYGFANSKPRTGSSIGVAGKYDGNIIGGAMLGVGMTLTGACPGTVLPQVATGVPSAPWVLLGGILGGTLWSYFGKSLLVKQNTKIDVPPPITISQELGISQASGLVSYEVLCLTILLAASLYAPTQPSLLPPIFGGILIGISQLTSLILTTNTLGVSSAYEQIGALIIYYLNPLDYQLTYSSKIKPSISATYFALGTILGSAIISRAIGLSAAGVAGGVEVGELQAVLGGAVMLFGSRLAGGCTSGHGISGMSLLSVSSFVSVAAMFAGGMGLAALLG